MMKLYELLFVILFILVYLYIPANFAAADDTDIVINEIMYNPDNCADSVCEYIEIFNSGSVPVDLAGWEISDNSGTDTITAYHVGSPTIIPSMGYAVLTDNVSSVILKGGIHLAVDDASIGNGLDNTADTLRLINSTQIVDTINYNSSDGANGNGSSLECANPFLDNSVTNNGNWGESTPASEYGTAGIQNSNYSGPAPPVPEHTTIVLVTLGIITLVVIVWNSRIENSSQLYIT